VARRRTLTGTEKEERNMILDLDAVVDILHKNDVEAYVEQTGGGTATIYAGKQADHEEPRYVWRDGVREQVGTETWARFPVIAGPGWFEGPGWSKGRADTGDFTIGPDDDGESDDIFTASDADNEATVAAEILRRHREVVSA
jgi:hypothetical protein